MQTYLKRMVCREIISRPDAHTGVYENPNPIGRWLAKGKEVDGLMKEAIQIFLFGVLFGYMLCLILVVLTDMNKSERR